MSRPTTPITLDGNASEASSALTATRLAPIFARTAGGSNAEASSAPVALRSLRDLCQRPIPQYNEFYSPFEPLRLDLPSDYSPFVNGQPLFDDREVYLPKLPKGKTLAPATKKPKRSWVWALGYALVELSHPKKHQYWACKRCKFNVRTDLRVRCCTDMHLYVPRAVEINSHSIWKSLFAIYPHYSTGKQSRPSGHS